MTKRLATGNQVPPKPPSRSYSTVALGAIMPKITRPAFKKKSPAGALLMSDWGLVMGPELALVTQPERLSGTTLTISCAGPLAMELSHQTSSLIARINAYAGQRLVESVRFVQGVRAVPVVEAHVVVGEPVAIDGFPPGDVHDALARVAAALRADRGKGARSRG